MNFAFAKWNPCAVGLDFHMLVILCWVGAIHGSLARFFYKGAWSQCVRLAILLLSSLSLSPLNLDRRHHPDTWKCTGKQEQSGSKYLAGPLRRGSVPLGQKYLLAAAACWTWVLTASICCGRAIFLGCVSLFLACFFDFCFPASLLFCLLLFCFCMRLCFYSPLLLCFSTFLLLRFSAFPASLLLCFLLFPASLLNYLLFCFSAFPSFLFFVLQISLKRCNITYYLNGLTPSAADPRREVHGTVDIHTTHSK